MWTVEEQRPSQLWIGELGLLEEGISMTSWGGLPLMGRAGIPN